MSALSRCGFHIPSTLETWYMILRWLPPRLGLKGNVDGSSSLSSSGGGGIVRNRDGMVIFAFSHYYGNVTNNEAEMRAVWDLICTCGDVGLALSVVESDSEAVIHMITGKMAIQWKCSRWCKLIQRHPMFDGICFSHCYRESNFAADFLAKQGGHSREDSSYQSFTDLPRELRGLCNLDRWGIPSIR